VVRIQPGILQRERATGIETVLPTWEADSGFVCFSESEALYYNFSATPGDYLREVERF